MDTMDNFLESTQDNDEDIFKEMDGYLDPEGSEAEPETDDTSKTEPENEEPSEESYVPTETDMVYSTQQVASMLNISRQTIFNYTAQYPEFIKPSYDQKKQKYFSATDLEVMRYIAALSSKRERQETIKERLCQMFPNLVEKQEQNPSLPANPGVTELQKNNELAETISSLVEEEIRNFFEIGMKGIYTRLDSVTDRMDGMDNALQNQMEAISKTESIARGIETAVSHSVDAINDMNRNVTSKVDRSINRNETSINKMQESLDRTKDLINKEIKERLIQNIDSTNSIQKDMERFKSTNISKKVDDLGRTIQEDISAEKKEFKEQIQELLRTIEKAMTPPEYHPEESKEYKALYEENKALKETLGRSKSAVMNMQEKIEGLETDITEREKMLKAQKIQMTACYSQIESYKVRLRDCEEQNSSFRKILFGSDLSEANEDDAHPDTAEEEKLTTDEIPEAEQTEEQLDKAPDPITENPADTDKDVDITPPPTITVSYKESPQTSAPDDLRGQVLLNNAEKPEKKGFFSRLFFFN